MSTTPDRDRDVEQLLRQVMPARTTSTNDCLDAESLAAWVEDGLGVDARAAAEAHVAGCARCQAALTAIVRSEPEVTAPRPWWRTSIVRWMAPALVTVGAATLWVLLPQRAPIAPAEDIRLQGRAPVGSESLSEPFRTSRESPAPRPADVPEGERPGEATAKRGAPRDTASGQAPHEPSSKPRAPGVAGGVPPTGQRASRELREGSPAEAATAAPSPTATAPAPATMAMADARDESRVQAPMRERTPLDVASPHPGERWRVVASAIDYTTDHGVTWERLDLRVDAAVAAGASPSRGVCWLVGRAGTILLTIDGRHWRHIAFTERVDLVAVDARDARTAAVTTDDGRVFTTTDGGAGWQPR